MNSDFLKIQFSLCSSFTECQGFNHAFLIIWSSDLNCQCSCFYGTCIDLLKYPSSYSNSITKQSLMSFLQLAASVLGRIPLCIQLISNDCTSFITIFHGFMNIQLPILIIF